MLKHILWFLIASVAAIFFKAPLSKLLGYLLIAHNKVAAYLTYIFSAGQAGQIIQNVLALIAIPLAVGIVVSLLYWAIKRAAMPHVMLMIWVVLLVMLVTLLAQVG